jgi:tetratricopeptide (TPR) repeat protein
VKTRWGTALACGLALALLLAAGCSSDEEKRAQHLQRADEYAEQGKDREALIELRNALKLDPQNPEINFRIAEVAERLGAYTDAIYYYGEAQRLRADYSDAALAEARLQIGDDDERAESLIRGVLEREPENVLALMRLCDLELSRRRVKAATKAVWKALAAAPEDYRVHLQHGILLRAKVRNALLKSGTAPDEFSRSALEAFEHGISKMDDQTPPPVVVRAWLERARTYASWSGHEKEAGEAFQKAAEVADRFKALKLRPEVYRASLEWAQGNTAPELQRWALEGLLEEAPEDYGAWVELARLEEAGGGSGLEVLERLVKERPADPNAHAYYARALDRKERHADAVAHLEKAVDEVEQKPIVLGTLVDLHIGAGELEAADKVVARMVEDHPNATHTQFAQGQTALAEGRNEEALEILGKMQGSFDNVRIQMLVAEGEARLGRADKALAAINRAIELSGEVPPIHLIRRRARLQGMQADWGGVIRTLRGVANRLGGRLNRDDVLLLVSAFYETGRADEGRRQLDALLASEDPPAEAALEFARREGARDPARAQQVLEDTLKRHPDNRLVLGQLVRRDLDAERFDEALARVDASLAALPEDAPLALMRGQVLNAKGDLPAAAEWGQKALDRAPGMEGAAQFLANVMSRQGRIDEAIATLEAQARVGSLGVSGTVLLARLQAGQGNRARAIELFEAALARRSDLPQAKNDLAYLLLDQGLEIERAFGLAQEAQRALPESPLAADTLGVAYLRKGLPGPAAEQIRYALNLAEKNGQVQPAFHYHLGLALRELGEAEQARIELEKALAAAVDFPDAERVRQILDELRSAAAANAEKAGSS